MNKLFPELNIIGLKLIEDFITESEETELIKNINNQSWLNDLTRRVQHYGYRYDYKCRKVTDLGGKNNFPDWLINLNNKIYKELSFDYNSCIINEYKSNQGITKHIDANCFTDNILTLSLHEDDEIEFQRGNIKELIQLKRRTCLILSGEARYKWTHCIKNKIRKNFRVSITFRNILK